MIDPSAPLEPWSAPPPGYVPVNRPQRPPVWAGWLAAGSGLAMLLGAMMPWASVDLGFASVSMSGTQSDDGKFIWVFGLMIAVAGLLVALGKAQAWLSILGILWSIISVVVLVIDGFRFTERAFAQLEGGYFLSLGGAFAAVFATVVMSALREDAPRR